MVVSNPPVLAHPSIPAARAYLTKGRALVRVQYDASHVRRDGFALYFTIIEEGERSAYVIKLCEDRQGRVTGSSDVSHGEPSC